MSTIRVAWGTATGPTETAAYDAALAEAGVHNYNLVTLSSVVPPEATIERVGTVETTLGEVGEGLHVVQACRVAPPGEAAAAGIGWTRSQSGRGIFYEEAGASEREVRQRIETGLDAGRNLRDWAFESSDEAVVAAGAAPDAYTAAVVVATYGESRPLL